MIGYSVLRYGYGVPNSVTEHYAGPMAKDGSTAATDGTATGSGDIARSLELLWGTGDRPSRGPKPGLTLDRIVTAAVAVADAEGLAAVSMRFYSPPSWARARCRSTGTSPARPNCWT